MATLESLNTSELQNLLQGAYREASSIANIKSEIKKNEAEVGGWGKFVIALLIASGLVWLFTYSFSENFIKIAEDSLMVSRIFFGVIASIAVIAAVGLFIAAISPGQSKGAIHRQLTSNQAALWAKSYHLRSIPECYQSVECIFAMIGFIHNKRASSFKECANLLEEAQWRARMEENARKAADYARYAAQKAESAEWNSLYEKAVEKDKARHTEREISEIEYRSRNK